MGQRQPVPAGSRVRGCARVIGKAVAGIGPVSASCFRKLLSAKTQTRDITGNSYPANEGPVIRINDGLGAVVAIDARPAEVACGWILGNRPRTRDPDRQVRGTNRSAHPIRST